MKLRDLIERLQEIEAELQDGLGDDVDPEIVAAYQPSYPLTGEIHGAVCLQEDGDEQPILARGQPVAWVVIGGHPDNLSPYAPRAVYEAAR